MHDPQDRADLIERIGNKGIEHVDAEKLPGVDLTAFEPVVVGLWRAWASVTYELFALGATYDAFCDTAQEMVPVFERERTRDTATH